VYRLNEAERSREIMANRNRQNDDIKRRREYREAHGIPETTGMAAWLGLGTVEEDARRKRDEAKREEALQMERDAVRERREFEEQQRGENGERGKEKRKVFFGIWGW
jgi:hypothetical protein